MNILDENILNDQRQQLLDWHIPIRQIGYELPRKGMKDDEIIPFLLTLSQPTFFSLDMGFYRRTLCHAKYGLVCLDVAQNKAASFVRQLLKHPQFNTHSKRMGLVVQVAQTGLRFWELNKGNETFLG
jgi:hypothetical protein